MGEAVDQSFRPVDAREGCPRRGGLSAYGARKSPQVTCPANCSRQHSASHRQGGTSEPARAKDGVFEGCLRQLPTAGTGESSISSFATLKRCPGPSTIQPATKCRTSRDFPGPSGTRPEGAISMPAFRPTPIPMRRSRPSPNFVTARFGRQGDRKMTASDVSRTERKADVGK